MLKMIKYEYRKNILSVIIVLLVIAAIQIYTLSAAMLDKRDHVVIGVSLFMMAAFACYAFVLLYGIISYSKDLKNKDGYLVFMTPMSSYQIIGAKLLTTFITGVMLVVIITALAVLDYNVVAKEFGLDSTIDMIKELFGSMGLNLTEILINILSFVFLFLIEFFMIVTVAYFAISLSCTLLQNSKAKGVVSFILFIVLIVAITIVASNLPDINIPATASDPYSMAWSLYSSLPTIILFVVCMVAGYLGSSLLLEKKISL